MNPKDLKDFEDWWLRLRLAESSTRSTEVEFRYLPNCQEVIDKDSARRIWDQIRHWDAMNHQATAEPNAVVHEAKPLRTNQESIYTALEILCVFCWFVLDGFWLLNWIVPTYVFSAFSILVALAMFRFVKRERMIVLIACADSSWLLMNILWAIGDLSHVSVALTAAKSFFWIGFAICGVAFGSSSHGKRFSALVLSRLRILKYFSQS